MASNRVESHGCVYVDRHDLRRSANRLEIVPEYDDEPDVRSLLEHYLHKTVSDLSRESEEGV